MGKVKDMTGEQYNNLIVLRFSNIKNNNSYWVCQCKLCGSETEVSRPNLRSGNTKDCGCQRVEKIKKAVTTHGQSKSPTWSTWSKMNRRIRQGVKHHSTYEKMYIDPRWVDSFEAFLSDMGERPKGKTIDRIDNSKGYYKENCKWSTQAEQNRNRSSNVMLTYNGKTMCAVDWAKEIGIHRDTIRRRLKKGLPLEKVLIK